MKYLRKLYDWVLSWAETPYGLLVLVILSFTEASVFPIPPDVLLIALCLGDRTKWFKFADWCSAASLVGGMLGYGIGWGLWNAVDQWFYAYVPGFSVEKFDLVQGLYEKYNFMVVFAAAFTPIPYKVITITAGVFGISFPIFMVASVVGRSARFFLVAFLLRRYGLPIKEFIDKRFNLVTVVFVLLLIAGFLVLKLFH